MKKIVLMGLLLLLFGIVRAQRFSKAEYFIDSDPGIGLSTNTVAVSDASDTAAVNFSYNVPLSSISNGFHFLGFRVMNKFGTWSLTESRPFYIFGNIATPTIPGLNKYEYFVDTDPGIGAATSGTFTTTDTANVSIPISLTGIGQGFHLLGIRFSNASGLWTINETRSFYVYTAPVAIKNSKIKSGEYYFDSIPANSQGTPIPAFTLKDTVSTSFSIPLGSLSAGNHSLIVRFKDSIGVWSMLESRNFYVYQPRKIVSSPPLVYMEYFIDTDPGLGAGVSVPVTKGDTLRTTLAINMSSLTVASHTLTLRVRDSVGIWSIAETKTFSTCNGLVTPDFSATEDCAGVPIAMNNFSTGTLTGASFKWDFQTDGIIDTTTLDANLFSKKFAKSGTYNITLTAVDKNGCTATAIHSLIVDAQPTIPTISPSGNVTFCPGSLGVKLTSSINNIVWSPTNDTAISILASGAGKYYVTATNQANGCTAQSNVVTVTKGTIKPGFTFSVINISGSTSKRVNFVDVSAGANKWLWRFGDFASGTGHTPFHIYSQAGAYIACQSVYDTINGCSADTCKLVKINALDSTFAAFSFIPGTTKQGADSIYFKNLSQNASKYYWTYSNGNYDTVANPKVNFPVAGIYNVCLRVYDPVSKGTSQTCNKVSVGSVICKLNAAYSFFADTSRKVTFRDQSDGDLSFWYWSFGDGGSSTSQNPNHQYTSDGFYLVSLSVSNGNNKCIDSYQEFVKVGNGNCKASFNYFVQGKTVTFTNNSTGSNLIYYWSFDDGTSSTLASPSNTFVKTGIYNVSLTITNTTGTCSDISVAQVLVGTVKCNASFSYYIDSVQNKVFFAPANALPSDKLFWTFGDGTIDTLKTPSHEFTAPGYFTVNLSLYNTSGCMDNQKQTLLIGREGIDCFADFIYSVSGSNVSFKDASKGKPTGYLWNFGEPKASNSISKDTAHSYNTGGYYNVCHLIVNKYGISNIRCKPVPVVITGKPNCLADFNFVVDQSSHKVTFNNNSIGSPNNFAWTFGDKLTSTDSTPKHTYVNADYYLVGLKIKNTTTGCSDQTYKIVNITSTQGKIKAGFGFDPQKYSAKAGGYPVDFIGAGLGDQSRLKWTFGDGSGVDSTTSSPQHVYNVAGTYQVCYFISDPITGQKDSVCQQIATQTLCASDATPPIPACKDITVQLNNAGVAAITPSMIDNGSADNCTKVLTTSVSPTSLNTVGGPYTVTLTVKDSVGNVSTCTAKVTVKAYSNVKTDQLFSGFEIYPNPVGSFTNINFNLKQESQIDIDLYDLEGKLVETIVKTVKPEGSNSIMWNSVNLPAGAYIIRLSATDGQTERKMLIKQ